MEDFILFMLIVSSVVSVLVMILNRNVFYAALGLLVCLISLAGIYALLQAEFLAVTQLLIYAGGVLVLIIFGIMLTNRISGKPVHTDSHNWLSGILLSIGLLQVLVFSFHSSDVISTSDKLMSGSHINNVGVQLMSTYVAPFEVSGILLLVCLVGAALTASSFKRKVNG